MFVIAALAALRATWIATILVGGEPPGPPRDLVACGVRGNFLIVATEPSVEIRADAGVLDEPRDVDLGPDGRLYVTSRNTNRVVRFDASTGEFLGTFADDGLVGTMGMEFAPNGNLYVCSAGNNQIAIFDPGGCRIGTISDPGIVNPPFLTFGPDGKLYVGSAPPPASPGEEPLGAVARFDGVTGAFEEFVVDATLGDKLVLPSGLLVAAGGRIFVGNRGPGEILEYDLISKAFVRAFGTAEINNPWDLCLGPDGLLYVADDLGERVHVFDLASGTRVNVLCFPSVDCPPSADFGPHGIDFIPPALADQPQVRLFLSLDPVPPGEDLVVTARIASRVAAEVDSYAWIERPDCGTSRVFRLRDRVLPAGVNVTREIFRARGGEDPLETVGAYRIGVRFVDAKTGTTRATATRAFTVGP